MRILCPLLALLICLPQASSGLTYHRGRHYYMVVLGSRIKYPVFTKEFTESPQLPTVGGIDQVWLADKSSTWGVRVGTEEIRPNGAGLGVGASVWHVRFTDGEFLYAHEENLDHIARYRNPTHTYATLDATGVVFVSETRHSAIALYGLLSLVGDYEEYTLERFSRRAWDPAPINLHEAARDDLNLRFGFGLGVRAHLWDHTTVWLEKRWIVGETFDGKRQSTPTGIVPTDARETLYVPITSLGLGMCF